MLAIDVSDAIMVTPSRVGVQVRCHATLFGCATAWEALTVCLSLTSTDMVREDESTAFVQWAAVIGAALMVASVVMLMITFQQKYRDDPGIVSLGSAMHVARALSLGPLATGSSRSPAHSSAVCSATAVLEAGVRWE